MPFTKQKCVINCVILFVGFWRKHRLFPVQSPLLLRPIHAVYAECVHVQAVANNGFYLPLRQYLCHGNKCVSQLVRRHIRKPVCGLVSVPVITIGLRTADIKYRPVLPVICRCSSRRKRHCWQLHGTHRVSVLPFRGFVVHIHSPPQMDGTTMYILPAQPD